MAVTFAKKTQKKKFSLKEALHRAIPGMEPARPTLTIHASELTKAKEFCPREYALLDSTGLKRKGSFIGTSLQTTFDTGKDFQRRVNEQYLPDLMIGDWKCLSCGTKKKFCKKPTTTCKSSGGACIWEYEEVRLKCPKTGASGGVDVLLDVGTGKALLAELKIIAPDDFKKLKAPLAEHRVRTQLYLELAKRQTGALKGKIETSYGIVLYSTRTFGFKDESLKEAGIKDSPFSPFKEFLVDANLSNVQTYLNKSQAIHSYRQGDSGMPMGVCKSPIDKRAKDCVVCKHCWSGKYPPEVTWRTPEDDDPVGLKLIAKG